MALGVFFVPILKIEPATGGSHASVISVYRPGILDADTRSDSGRPAPKAAQVHRFRRKQPQA